MTNDPEDQILAMEDDQIITAAAYFVAYNSVVGTGKVLTNSDIIAELKKYDNYDDTRLHRLIHENEEKIHEMVGTIFNATIPGAHDDTENRYLKFSRDLWSCWG